MNPGPFAPIKVLSALGAVLVLAATAAMTAGASSGFQYCDAIPRYHGSGIPAGSGIPPWGFHTGPPITGATGSFARGFGDFNFATNFISGKVCQVDRVRNQPDRLIVVKTLAPMLYHSHAAVMWGYPGNLIKTRIKVLSSTDARCKVGTKGLMTMYASYNGVRSDSVQFSFPAACRSHNRLYHGPQVNAQVPPL